jgi:hypothetical protein
MKRDVQICVDMKESIEKNRVDNIDGDDVRT